MNVNTLPCLEPVNAPVHIKSRVSKIELADVELVVASKHGDQIAFKRLLQRHQHFVFGQLSKLMPERQDHSDLAQEVFIRIWRSIGKLRNPYAFRSWVSEIVLHLFYDELRRRPAQQVISIDSPWSEKDGDESESMQIPDTAARPDEFAERRELRRAIEHGLTALPTTARTMIVLRDFHGLSYMEISEMTHSELGTVKSRIARARRKLQNQLLPYIKDGTVCMLASSHSA